MNERQQAEQQYLSLLPDNMGSEGLTIKDINVSMLKIAQKLSPEVDSNHQRYIEGATEGMIIDGATRQVYENLLFLPIKHVKKFVEWVPREQGGGWVANHNYPPQPVDKNFKLPNGNTLNETSYFIGWIINGSEKTVAMIPMEKTALAAARQFNTLIFTDRNDKGQPVPMGFRVYQLSTAIRRKLDRSWYGWKIERTGGTIVNWCLKFNKDLKLIAQEAKELNEKGGTLLEMGGPKEEAKTTPAIPAQTMATQPEDRSEIFVKGDDDDMPF